MSSHIFTVIVEAPDFVSRELIAENIKGALLDRIGSKTTYTVDYSPITELETYMASDKGKAELQEIEKRNKPKYGEPGFHFPACDQCGSVSLRCGCD